MLLKRLEEKRFFPFLRAGLLLLLFLFFSVLPMLPMLLAGGRLAYGDEIASHFPYHEFVKNTLFSKGQIPFWNPYNYSGVPYFSNLQMGTSITYPFFLLAYLDYNLTFHIFHWTVALVGIYLLQRKLSISRLAAVLATFLFSLTLAKQGFGMQGAFVSWIPFVFLFCEYAANDSRIRYYCGLSVVLFLILLIWAELAFYTTFVAFLYLVIRMIMLHKERRFQAKTVGMFLAANLLALGLIAFQALPFAEYAAQSLRGNFSADLLSAAHTSITPFNLIFLFAPKLLGSQSQQPLLHVAVLPYYLGAVTLFSAYFALGRKKALTFPFFLVGAFAILYSLGAYFPLYPMLFQIPPFSKFLSPAKMMIFFAFSITVLSGFGLDYLLNKSDSSPKTQQRFYKYIFILVAIYTVVASIIYAIFWDIQNKMPFILSGFNVLQLLPLFFVAILYAVYKKNDGIRPGLVISIFVFIAIVDFLLVHGSDPYRPYANKKMFSATPPSVKFLRKDKEIFRIVRVGTSENSGNWVASAEIGTRLYDKQILGHLDRLAPNLPVRYNLYDANGYEPVILKHYAQLVAGIYSSQLRAGLHELAFPDYHPILFKLLNIKYIISDSPLTHPNLKLVYRGNSYIYQNLDSMPRTFIATKPIYALDEDRSLQALLQKSFQPKSDVVILGRHNSPSTWRPSTRHKIKILSYQPNSIKVKATLNGMGYLVVSDSHFPGWKAYVNGKEQRIHRANHAFRAILLNKGTHQITFKYQPSPLKKGIIISIIAFIILLGLLLADYREYLPSFRRK